MTFLVMRVFLLGGRKMEFVTIREIYELVYSNAQAQLDSLEYIEVQGWVLKRPLAQTELRTRT